MAFLRASRSPALLWAIGVTVFLFVLRIRLSRVVGFGDAEALYACYALHPQPAYLDHPGLVGAISRFVGDGTAPTPLATHRFTALAATALPWTGVLAARAAGAARGPALRTFFALALVPEVSIGLFALTPDLPLAYTWILALGAAALAVRSPPGSGAALVGAGLSGLATGLAIESKVTGLLLLVALVVGFATTARSHARTPAPWFGLVVALIVAAPVFAWERSNGFPMLTHRLVETAGHRGPSLRNLGALVGGQLLYVTPPFLIAAYAIYRDLLSRRPDPVSRFLVVAATIPAVPLVVLCSWSRVAEPHWLAPAYLALALGAGLSGSVGRRLARASVAVGLAAAVFTWIWVGTPIGPEWLGRRYVPRFDLANDLYAWEGALRILERDLADARTDGRTIAVVAPHWVMCAQIHAALGTGVPVGCESPGNDDFATWFPRNAWSTAQTLLYVTDDRFPGEPERAVPDRAFVSAERYHVYRGSRLVRTIRITRLERKAFARG